MTPQQWAAMSWHARRRYIARRNAPTTARSVADMAREIAARMAPDPDVAAHLAAMDHYTATPRRRTA